MHVTRQKTIAYNILTYLYTTTNYFPAAAVKAVRRALLMRSPREISANSSIGSQIEMATKNGHELNAIWALYLPGQPRAPLFNLLFNYAPRQRPLHTHSNSQQQSRSLSLSQLGNQINNEHANSRK